MKRTIRFLGGASMAGQQYTRGDELTGREKDVRPLVDSGTAEWFDGDTGSGAEVDETTWTWSVSEAREHVASETDPATLRSWHRGEARNPKYTPDGRKGVRDAIEERLGELRVDHAAEGLARGPEA